MHLLLLDYALFWNRGFLQGIPTDTCGTSIENVTAKESLQQNGKMYMDNFNFQVDVVFDETISLHHLSTQSCKAAIELTI